MNQIPKTLLILLKQEWITVGVYCIATILFMLIIFTGEPELSAERLSGHQSVTLMLITMLSTFIGLYLGSGFLRLKQSFLWLTLPSYRHTLISSLVLAALFYGVIQYVAMSYALWSLPIALLAPPAITLLAAQAVIGKNLIMKVILPISPFVLFQLTQFNIDLLVILCLLLVLTCLAVFMNYSNDKIENESTLGLMSGNLEKQIQNSGLQKINYRIGDFFQKLGAKNLSTNLNVALMRPNNRFGISSVIGTVAVLLFFHAVGEANFEAEGLAALLMISVLIGVFLELKLLAKQCKPFAHLFSADTHWDFKQRIITTLQKFMMIQALSYILILMLLNIFLEGFVEIELASRYILSVTLVGLIFLPAFLCLNWFSINIKLLAVIISYATLSVSLCGWFYNYHSMSSLYSQMAATILLLILVQWLAKTWWKRQPIEYFFRAHG